MTVEIALKSLVQKGIGSKLKGELALTPFGKIVPYQRYANFITDGNEGFNVMVMHNPIFSRLGNKAPKLPEVYLFPSMVSMRKAREKYDKLR